MRSNEFIAEVRRLVIMKEVRPATPEYLAEIDAKIDALRAKYVGDNDLEKGMGVILANLKSLLERMDSVGKRNVEAWAKFDGMMASATANLEEIEKPSPKVPIDYASFRMAINNIPLLVTQMGVTAEMFSRFEAKLDNLQAQLDGLNRNPHDGLPESPPGPRQD